MALNVKNEPNGTVPNGTVDNIKEGKLEYNDEPLVPALFFIQCHLSWLTEFKQKHFNQFMIYTDVPGGKPAPIRDEEMDVFIRVTSVQNNNGSDVEILEPKPQ